MEHRATREAGQGADGGDILLPLRGAAPHRGDKGMIKATQPRSTLSAEVHTPTCRALLHSSSTLTAEVHTLTCHALQLQG